MIIQKIRKKCNINTNVSRETLKKNTDEYYMKLALKQAKKAFKYEEVPVGAIIVKNNKIISQAHNRKEKNMDVTKHAEIIAISNACKKVKNWRLDDCSLYVTMEPCMMCTGAINQARIKKIIYGIRNEKTGFSKHLNSNQIISQLCETECKELVQSFFQKRR